MSDRVRRTTNGYTACELHAHPSAEQAWPCGPCASAAERSAAALALSTYAITRTKTGGDKSPRTKSHHSGRDGAPPDRRGRRRRVRLGRAGRTDNSAHPARRAAYK